MAYNIKRKEKMQGRTEKELLDIVKSGSLSASAAAYELDERGFARKTRTGDGEVK